jgi:hypothetical protein
VKYLLADGRGFSPSVLKGIFHVKSCVFAAFFIVIRYSFVVFIIFTRNERRRNQKALKIQSRFLYPHVYEREELPNTMRRETWAAIEGSHASLTKFFLKNSVLVRPEAGDA